MREQLQRLRVRIAYRSLMTMVSTLDGTPTGELPPALGGGAARRPGAALRPLARRSPIGNPTTRICTYPFVTTKSLVPTSLPLARKTRRKRPALYIDNPIGSYFLRCRSRVLVSSRRWRRRRSGSLSFEYRSRHAQFRSIRMSGVLEKEGVQRSARGARCAGPCLLYTSPSPRDKRQSRMPSSA